MTASVGPGPVRDLGDPLELVPAVLGADRADRPRARAHHERLGDGAFTGGPYAVEQVSVGDSGRREEDVLTRHEVVRRQHAVEVVAAVDRALTLVVVARPQLPLDLAAEALERARGRDALRGTTDPVEQIHAVTTATGDDRTGHVAVGDEPDPGAAL